MVAIEVFTDNVHDVKAFPDLMKGANEKRRIARWLGDEAYDMCKVIKALGEQGVEAVGKPRRNSVQDLGSSVRERAVREFQELGNEDWARDKGYDGRWVVEAVFSSFKTVWKTVTC